MLTKEEIQNQIFQFLQDKDLTDEQRAGFLVASVDVVRQKMALEIEEAMEDKDVDDIEKMTGSDDDAMAEMVKRWENKTGKKGEDRLQEIILEYFDKFLQAKQ